MIPKNFLGILSSLILICNPVAADDLADRIQCSKPGNCVVDIESGQIAPMSGQLMTHSMALSLGLKLEFKTKELELKLEKAKSLFRIEIQKEKDLRISNNKHCKDREKILSNQMSRPFYEHPVVVAIITATAVLGCVYAAGQLK